ncbi:hypothetical protein SAMN04489761_4618 [Tenacibaculum sp. MAR_2009_124]|uniref:hypothetical protein n=1 Tax=Tenacibaculum sp. MAR_2009_124 TaxID=1250059 RepID=UPI000897B160|nr:hypothetical protein [Tenacibaculum sp. MAR_2009_124]SED20614.1 hypothetical protein SAMN04489761_4618 [Tenacibaculum sp. MAR_2009_124]
MIRRKEIYITQPILRNNRELFRKKHLFERTRADTLKEAKGKLSFKIVSLDKLQTIKEKIIKKKYFDKVLECIIVLTVTLVFIILTTSVIIQEKGKRKELKEMERVAYMKLNIPKYRFYIDDGNKWLREGHYKNARYQFRKALELFPENELAKEKLNIANFKSKNR